MGVYDIARADDYFHVDQSLYALMNSGARHAALQRDVFRRNTRVLHHNVQDFLVEVVKLFHSGFKMIKILCKITKKSGYMQDVSCKLHYKKFSF